MNLLSRRQIQDERRYPFVAEFKSGAVRHFTVKRRDMMGHIAMLAHHSELGDCIGVRIESQ